MLLLRFPPHNGKIFPMEPQGRGKFYQSRTCLLVKSEGRLHLFFFPVQMPEWSVSITPSDVGDEEESGLGPFDI